MARALLLSAIAGALIISSVPVLAASQTSTRTPGHKMQTSERTTHHKTVRGASSYSPGHAMQATERRTHHKTVRGASSYTPSH